MDRRVTTTLVLAIMVSMLALTAVTTPVLAVRPDGETISITFEGGSSDPAKREWVDRDSNSHIRVMVIEGVMVVSPDISDMDGGTFEGIQHGEIYASGEMYMWGQGRITTNGPELSYQIQFQVSWSSTMEISGSFKIEGRGVHIEGTEITQSNGDMTFTGTYWHN
jgi:hypothetical protein